MAGVEWTRSWGQVITQHCTHNSRGLEGSRWTWSLNEDSIRSTLNILTLGLL